MHIHMPWRPYAEKLTVDLWFGRPRFVDCTVRRAWLIRYCSYKERRRRLPTPLGLSQQAKSTRRIPRRKLLYLASVTHQCLKTGAFYPVEQKTKKSPPFLNHILAFQSRRKIGPGCADECFIYHRNPEELLPEMCKQGIHFSPKPWTLITRRFHSE